MLMSITDGWDGVKETIPNHDLSGNSVSIIIPARNEAKNIKACIQSVIQSDARNINYEILLIDDHSEDETSELVKREFPNVNILKLDATQGKKAAIDLGISKAVSDHCIIIDADVIVSSSWLTSHCTIWKDEKPWFVAGPVLCSYKENLLSAFQIMDYLALAQTIANGIKRRTYHIANGANMAISKKIYEEIGGIKDHAHVASGDDMFLIKKVAGLDPLRVSYLKDPEAVAYTLPEESWLDFLRQRKRWSTKTKALPKDDSYRIQTFIFGIHLLIILNFIFIPLTGGTSFFTGIFMLFIKGCIDFLFLSKIGRYFSIKRPFKLFIPALLIYFPYIFYMAFHAVKGGNYQWKGRSVS